MTYITDTQPALSSSWLSSGDRSTDVTERASTSKEKADKIVDKRGKTNSVVWKWFGFLRSDKLQVSVIYKCAGEWCRLAAGTGA